MTDITSTQPEQSERFPDRSITIVARPYAEPDWRVEVRRVIRRGSSRETKILHVHVGESATSKREAEAIGLGLGVLATRRHDAVTIESSKRTWLRLLDSALWRRLDDEVPAASVQAVLHTLLRYGRLSLDQHTTSHGRSAIDETTEATALGEVALNLLMNRAQEEVQLLPVAELGWCVDASSGTVDDPRPHIALVPMRTSGRLRAQVFPVPPSVPPSMTNALELYGVAVAVLRSVKDPTRKLVYTDSTDALKLFERARPGPGRLGPNIPRAVVELVEAVTPHADAVAVRWMGRNATTWMTAADAAAKHASGAGRRRWNVPTQRHDFDADMEISYLRSR